MGLNNLQGVETAAFLVFTIIQVTLVAGIQTDTVTTATPSTSSSPPSVFHGIGKRSVSILARNGDLPYYRKEWNKKLHPGFRGMNLENKDDTLVVSQRNVGALARGGGFPMVTGKRDSDRLNSLSSIWPDEAILEEYLAEELRKRLLRRELAAESKNMDVAAEEELEEDPEASEEFTEKRGGVGALARGGYMPTEGRYSSGKRSVAALARSGELLSIGRGSNQDRENGNGATKRGIGSILRNGGISTIGKIPVYNVGNLNHGKRGIESLARNYALPSTLNQEYAKKYDIIDNEGEDINSRQMAEPYNDEFMLASDNMDAPGMVVQEGMIKRHLGSYARNYGLRLNNKRSIGSIVRNNGVLHYNGKRKEDDIPDYDEDYSVTQKRHIASLLRNQDGFVPGKRDTEEYASGEGKRHLASIWNDNNSVTKGKRYIGSIARQGLLSGRHEKRDTLEGIYDDDQYTRGDYAVGKRSIAEDQSSSIEGEAYLDQQHGGSAMNSTADAEPKKVAPSTSSGSLQKISLRQKGDVSEEAKPEKKKENDEPFSQRQRRSLTVPYTTSDEYPMPVLQNTDFYDWDITDEDEIAGAPDKRFMGRIPHMGRSRPRTGSQSQSPSRRRPRYH